MRVEATRFDLSSLPEDLRRQMKQLTYKQLQKEELTELNRIISGTQSDQIGNICPRLRDLRARATSEQIYLIPDMGEIYAKGKVCFEKKSRRRKKREDKTADAGEEDKG